MRTRRLAKIRWKKSRDKTQTSYCDSNACLLVKNGPAVRMRQRRKVLTNAQRSILSKVGTKTADAPGDADRSTINTG
jgi:hypothetical protein